jgi:RNA polymerase sigma-70 factor (ECF subfamily)
MSKMPDQHQPSPSETILAEIPRLRVYARLMTNDPSSADLQVADALQHAFSDVERLRACKDLRVHLFSILRTLLASGSFRIENGHLERPVSLATALLCLTFEAREAVVLRTGLKLSGEQAATIIGCELHIYDARVRRGLTRLAELLPQAVFPKAARDAMMGLSAFSGAETEPREMLLH